MYDMKLKDAGKTRKESNNVQMPATSEFNRDEKIYPTLEISEQGYNSIPLDVEDYEAGDKVCVVLICNVKEKVDRKTATEKKKDEEYRATLEVLECGIKPHEKKKTDEEENSEELDKALKS